MNPYCDQIRSKVNLDISHIQFSSMCVHLPSWCGILCLPSHPRHYLPLRFFHDLHDHQRLQYSLHLEKPKSCGYSALSVRQIHESIEQFHSVGMQEHKSNLALGRVHYKMKKILRVTYNNPPFLCVMLTRFISVFIIRPQKNYVI